MGRVFSEVTLLDLFYSHVNVISKIQLRKKKLGSGDLEITLGKKLKCDVRKRFAPAVHLCRTYVFRSWRIKIVMATANGLIILGAIALLRIKKNLTHSSIRP